MTRPNQTHREVQVSGSFVCSHCRRVVAQNAYGTDHRNHCPYCLWSKHLDQTPGDRKCACQGEMEPIAIWVRQDGEWAIVHRCDRCSSLRSNRIAGDDDPTALLRLAARPLAFPAFPLDCVAVDSGKP